MMTISGRDFDRDSAAIRKSVHAGPIFIMEDDAPSQVLLTMVEYEALSGKRRSLADTLGMPEEAGDAIDIDFPRINFELRVPDF